MLKIFAHHWSASSLKFSGWIVSLFLFCTVGLTGAVNAETGQKYLVLCYHSVPTVFNGDPDGVSVLNLAQQLAWLRESGYTPISMQDVILAKYGMKPLPERAFLLTVDDGFADFYTHVFPLLKLFKVPAVFGVVGRWIEQNGVQQNETDPYFRQQRFVTWEQVKEMSDSGWVEIASHSYDLHHGIVANPQGNVKPAAVTLQYDKATKTYETPEQQRLRVRLDLERNAALIQKYTGKPPRVMVWPYGAMDSVGVEEAALAGMPINFTLRDGLASTTGIQAVERSLVGEEPLLNKFSYLVKYGIPRQDQDPIRAITLSLDRIYDADPVVQEERLGRLIEQMVRLEVNTVVIKPFTASGRQAYFPNAVLPMRADLLNRVTWQLRSRTSVNVYLNIPHNTIEQQKDGEWHLLDAFQPADREQLLMLYSDLSHHATAQGLLFDQADAQGTGHTMFKDAVVQRMRYFRPDLMSVQSDGAIISVAVKNSSTDAFAQAIAKMRLLQRKGVDHFLLDSDDFLDDPKRLEQIRQVYSLKENPYL